MIVQFRSAPTYRMQQELQIDRHNLVIRDLVAMQADVEALGHGMMTDRKSLEMVAELGNKSTRPIRGRFGHPGVSENSTGKQVMVASNFRLKEDKRGVFLVHDADFLPAARLSPAFAQDPLEYIFTMAETAPSEFAESIVAQVATVWVTAEGKEIPVWEKRNDEDGYPYWHKNERPDDATTDLPVMRPAKLWYVDLVNEGAVTHAGMFGTETLDISEIFNGHSSAYAHELFDIVDRWRDAYHIQLPDLKPKVDQLLNAYVSTRKDTPTMAHKQFEPGDGHGHDNQGQSQQPVANPTPRRKPDAAMQAANALLEQAEQLAQTASQQAVMMDQVSGQVVNRAELTAQSETLQDLQIQVSELRTAVNTLTDRYNTLASRQQEFQDVTIKMQTAAQNAINHMQMQLAMFQQNLQRMDGQPVVANPVRMHGDLNQLQPIAFSGPTPGAWAGQQQPQHFSQRRQEIAYDDNSPEGQAIRAQQRRQHYSV